MLRVQRLQPSAAGIHHKRLESHFVATGQLGDDARAVGRRLPVIFPFASRCLALATGVSIIRFPLHTVDARPRLEAHEASPIQGRKRNFTQYLQLRFLRPAALPAIDARLFFSCIRFRPGRKPTMPLAAPAFIDRLLLAGRSGLGLGATSHVDQIRREWREIGAWVAISSFTPPLANVPMNGMVFTPAPPLVFVPVSQRSPRGEWRNLP